MKRNYEDYNWNSTGPDGCDSHCVPHPCGPCAVEAGTLEPRRRPRPKPKYYIEIDTGGAEASGYEDRLPWVSYGTIVSEGNTLDELLDNASVDLIDQDGGERGQVEADADWMQMSIAEEFYGQSAVSGETLGDFRARMERDNVEPQQCNVRSDI